MTPMITQLNQLGRLISIEGQENNVNYIGRPSGKKQSGKSQETVSTDSQRMAEMESYSYIDQMWRFYTPENLAKRPRPSMDKLARMIWAKVNERVRSFDA